MFSESFIVVFELTDIRASLKSLDNISVIIRTKKYDNDTSLSFHLVQAFGAAKGFINLILSKTILFQFH